MMITFGVITSFDKQEREREKKKKKRKKERNRRKKWCGKKSSFGSYQTFQSLIQLYSDIRFSQERERERERKLLTLSIWASLTLSLSLSEPLSSSLSLSILTWMERKKGSIFIHMTVSKWEKERRKKGERMQKMKPKEHSNTTWSAPWPKKYCFSFAFFFFSLSLSSEQNEMKEGERKKVWEKETVRKSEWKSMKYSGHSFSPFILSFNPVSGLIGTFRPFSRSLLHLTLFLSFSHLLSVSRVNRRVTFHPLSLSPSIFCLNLPRSEREGKGVRKRWERESRRKNRM